jgi:hypothetical protein
MLYKKIFIFQKSKAKKEKHDEKQCSIFTRPDKKWKQRQRRKPSEPITNTNKVLLNLKYKHNVYEYKDSGKGRESMSRRRWKLHKEGGKKKSAYLLTLPLPPVLTALAIFMSFSLFMVAAMALHKIRSRTDTLTKGEQGNVGGRPCLGLLSPAPFRPGHPLFHP